MWRRRAKNGRNILHTVQWRKVNLIGHILCRTCILKHGNDGKTGGTKGRGIRCEQLLHVLKKQEKYCNLKDEAQDRTVGRRPCGWSCGPLPVILRNECKRCYDYVALLMDELNIRMSTGGIKLRGENPKNSEKTLSSVTSTITNTMWTSFVMNTNKWGERPVTNRLTNGKEYVLYLPHSLKAAYCTSQGADHDDPYHYSGNPTWQMNEPSAESNIPEKNYFCFISIWWDCNLFSFYCNYPCTAIFIQAHILLPVCYFLWQLTQPWWRAAYR